MILTEKWITHIHIIIFFFFYEIQKISYSSSENAGSIPSNGRMAPERGYEA